MQQLGGGINLMRKINSRRKSRNIWYC